MKLFQNKKLLIGLAVALALAITAVAGWLFVLPHFTFSVTDGATSATVFSLNREPEAVLSKLNIALREEDVYTATQTRRCVSLQVIRAQEITVTVGDTPQTLYTQGETVAQLLSRHGIDSAPPWVLSVSPDQQTQDQMQIRLDYVEEKPYLGEQEIPFETLYCNDPSLPEGQQEVFRAGVPGKQELTGTAVYVNGCQESVTVAQTAVVTQPQKQIVIVGTGENTDQPRQYPLVGENILITADGQCLHYSHMEVFNATAYTSWYQGTTGTNYCGNPAREGTVAVDPKVIPYYTKMYIVSQDGIFDYGVASAEDCGGAIKGKIIDLFYDTLEECFQFGRRDILVYFLTEEPV